MRYNTHSQKKKSERCKEYRTIRLTTHAFEILMKTMHEKIKTNISENLTEGQFGFRKNRDT